VCVRVRHAVPLVPAIRLTLDPQVNPTLNTCVELLPNLCPIIVSFASIQPLKGKLVGVVIAVFVIIEIDVPGIRVAAAIEP
jgi:hypothetical protein